MNLPKDSVLLYSAVNLKLRDFYPSLTALCEDMEVSEEEIKEKLRTAGFTYDEKQNRFI